MIDLALFVDGVEAPDDFFQRVPCANTAGITTMLCHWGMSGVVLLTPGSHTVSVRVKYVSGATAHVSGNTASVLQGALTVLILKQ